VDGLLQRGSQSGARLRTQQVIGLVEVTSTPSGIGPSRFFGKFRLDGGAPGRVDLCKPQVPCAPALGGASMSFVNPALPVSGVLVLFMRRG
jgi:hypothetical protein